VTEEDVMERVIAEAMSARDEVGQDGAPDVTRVVDVAGQAGIRGDTRDPFPNDEERGRDAFPLEKLGEREGVSVGAVVPGEGEHAVGKGVTIELPANGCSVWLRERG
jgi:hypothetical protein